MFDIGFEGCKEKIKNWLIRAFVVFLFIRLIERVIAD